MTLTIQYRDPTKLVTALGNPRHMAKEDMEALKRNLKTFGFVDPVIVRRTDNLIIGGHQRVKAAIELGMTNIPVVELDVTEEQARVLNVSLNRISGEFDAKLLAEWMTRIPADDKPLTGLTSKELQELEALLKDVPAPAEAPAGAPSMGGGLTYTVPFDTQGEMDEWFRVLRIVRDTIPEGSLGARLTQMILGAIASGH